MRTINLQNLPGIYFIYCQVKNTIYIGSSFNARRRLSLHLSVLKGNYHDNKKLQNYFNKYGKDSFIFSILEYCEKDNNILLNKELYWFNIAKNKYKLFNLASIQRNNLPNEYLSPSKRGKRNKGKIPALGYSKTYNNKYVVRCNYELKEVYFGTYEDEEEAKQVYQQAIKINSLTEAKEFAQKQKIKLRERKGRKYYGVKKRKNNKYQSVIAVNKQNIYLGIYEYEKDAALAYNNYILSNNLDKKLNILDC